MPANKIFIAVSLDGYIADQNGSVEFLNLYPDPKDEDMGFHGFMQSVDALLMGRKTFETVLGFGVEWPYTKPVYVWTSTLREIPAALEGKVRLLNGSISEILEIIHSAGYVNLYIDGGQVIQSFLNDDLIGEMIITIVPVLIGAGIPLFGTVKVQRLFTCTETKAFSNGLVQSRFLRKPTAR